MSQLFYLGASYHFVLCVLQEAFTAFHNDVDYVKKYMSAIRLGRVAPTETVTDEKELQKDFAELRQTVQKMVSLTVKNHEKLKKISDKPSRKL